MSISAALSGVGTLVTLIDGGASLWDRYQHRRADRDYQQLKVQLAEVMFLRAAEALVRLPSEQQALFERWKKQYLARNNGWRERLLDRGTATEREYEEVFGDLRLYDGGIPSERQREVLRALEQLTLHHESPGFRILSERLDRLGPAVAPLPPSAGTVPSPLPLPMQRTLEADCEAFGEESIVLGQVGIPLITPWTRELDGLFQRGGYEQSQRFAAWFSRDNLQGDPLVMRVLKAAVHGQIGEAEAELMAMDPAGWTLERRITRLRLLGVLATEAGDSPQAERHYRRAKTLLDGLPDSPTERWLSRRLLLDLNRVRDDDDHDAFFEQHEVMLGLPAWYSNPVTDALMRDVAALVSQEAHAQKLDRRQASRSSSNLFDAWQKYCQAQFIAYACGDAYDLEHLRGQWAQLLLTLPGSPLSDILTALWRASQESLLEKVLRAEPLEAYRENPYWNEWLLARPRSEKGPASEAWNLMTLKAIQVLAPYLDHHTLTALRDELWAGITEHHRRSRGKVSRREYEPVPFVEGRRYAPSYAVDALVAVTQWEPLTTGHVRGLADALIGEPFDRMGSWKVLAQHDWRPDDLPAARALLEGFDLPATDWDLDGAVELLSNLTQTYPEEPAFEARLLSVLQSEDLRHLDPRTRWLTLLQFPHQQAATYVRDQAFSYFSGIIGTLKDMTGKESIILNRTHPVRFLPLLLEHYPEALSEQQRHDLLEGLFDALPNENIYVAHKVAMLTALRLAWTHLSPELREHLTGRLRQLPAAASLVRVTDRPGPGYAPTPAPVQFQRLLLHAKAGLPPLPGDEMTLCSTLVTGHESDLTSALGALNLLLEQGRAQPDVYLPGLIVASQGKGRPAGEALYLLIRFTPEHPYPYGGMLDHLMSAAAQSGNAHQAVAVVRGLNALPESHSLRRSSAELVENLKSHPHRIVRAEAETLGCAS